MITSWWAVAECTHFVQTHPPALGIFVAQDQDRAVKCIDYARVLFDEAAFIDKFAEAFSAALFTKAKKILAATTAKPGDFREMTRNGIEEPLPKEWLKANAVARVTACSIWPSGILPGS